MNQPLWCLHNYFLLDFKPSVKFKRHFIRTYCVQGTVVGMGDADIHMNAAQVSLGTVLQQSCGQSVVEHRGEAVAADSRLGARLTAGVTVGSGLKEWLGFQQAENRGRASQDQGSTLNKNSQACPGVLRSPTWPMARKGLRMRVQIRKGSELSASCLPCSLRASLRFQQSWW